jgi:DNA-binding NtrC family response regulator
LSTLAFLSNYKPFILASIRCAAADLATTQVPLREAQEVFRKAFVEAVLAQAGDSQSKAARLLRINRNTVHPIIR